MAHQKGSTSKLMIGWESTFKTPATTGFIMPYNTSGVSGQQAMNSVATMRSGRNPRAGYLGNKDVNGPLIVPVDSIAMLYWLKAMFGTATVTGSYVHEYKIGDTMPSFTLEHQYPDLDTAAYEQFYGCKIASASFDFGGDGELVGNLNVVGADYSLESSAFDGSPTTITEARLANSQAAFEEGGASFALARRVKMDIDFGLDTDQFVIGGGGVRRSLPEGVVAVKGELEACFENTSLLTKAENSTETSLKVTCTGSATSVFELELQELTYERKSPGIQTPGGIVITLGFNAYYSDGSEASAIVARVTNAITGAV